MVYHGITKFVKLLFNGHSYHNHLKKHVLFMFSIGSDNVLILNNIYKQTGILATVVYLNTYQYESISKAGVLSRASFSLAKRKQT
jgi:hypothetical protein